MTHPPPGPSTPTPPPGPKYLLALAELAVMFVGVYVVAILAGWL